jgi:hypothetical protein
MFGGIDQVFGLKVNFDIGKIESGNYGFECWKSILAKFRYENLWKICFHQNSICLQATPIGRTYSICIEAMAMKQSAKDLIDELAEKLVNNDDFKKISYSNGIEDYNNK